MGCGWRCWRGLLAAAGVRTAQPARPAFPSSRRPRSGAERALEHRIASSAAPFRARSASPCARSTAGRWRAGTASRFFPQQSVSKFWVAITAFQRVDAGALDLDRRVTITRSDLTLFNQPIAAQIGPNGYTTTLGNLCSAR